jgi:beta-xylosidase
MLLVIYKYEQPRCSGRWHPHEYGRWHSNKFAWMKGDMFEAWISQLNKGLKQKVITLLDNASSHVVTSVKVGKSHGSSTLELSNMTLVFLPPMLQA